jgi:phage-related protein (TIGR01555 family)
MAAKPTPIRKELRSSKAAPLPLKISSTAMGRARHRRSPTPVPDNPFAPYEPMPGVIPKGEKPVYAQDDAFSGISDWSASNWATSAFLEGTTFLGYPYLAQLAQRPEYRVASEVIAQDCTREWITIKTKGDEDKSDKIAELEAELARLDVQKVVQTALEKDGQSGRAHIYIDTDDTDDKAELELDIGNGRDIVSQAKVGKGDLNGLIVVEAMWAYPQRYESNNPLKRDWYNPTTWYVMSQAIHRSRLLTIVGRPVPDILKPAYAFGGLSMSQMMKPYVDNWLRTRQSVSDIVARFVINILKTNMGTTMQAGGEQLFTRVDFMNAIAANHDTLVIDKDTEDWTNVQTSLASLDLIQAQSQEHMCSVTRIPVVKLLGIQPAGLNASSQGEIETYDDTIAAYQEKIVRPPLTTIVGFAQLNLWGEVDPGITFDFNPLRQLTELELAQLEKTKADTDDVYVAMGAIQPTDVQTRLQSDEDSPYHGLDLEPPPEPPDMGEGGFGGEPGGMMPGGEPGAGGDDFDLASHVAETVISALSPSNDDTPAARVIAHAVRTAVDAAFSESDHPRDEEGKFTTYLHGTSSEYLENIKKNGLSAGGAGRRFGLPDHYEGERANKVFLTRDPGAANRYANAATGIKHEPVVLSIQVPHHESHRVTEDPWATLAHQFSGTIPPEWIKSVAINGITRPFAAHDTPIADAVSALSPSNGPDSGRDAGPSSKSPHRHSRIRPRAGRGSTRYSKD